jgi:hypothetical protein
MLKRPNPRNCSLRARCSTLKRAVTVSVKNCYGFQPFSPKNPHFDLSKPQNLIPKMFIGHICSKTLKHAQVLRWKHQNDKIHQFTKFSQLSTTTTNSSPIHQIMILNASIHQQQHLNMNSSTIQQPQHYSSSISPKTHHVHIYPF